MKAKSIKGKSPEEIKSAFHKSMEDGFKPTLAIMFLSIKQDHNAVCKILDNENIAIFGATTAGEFIDGEIEEGSIVMMLLDMNPAFFKIEFLETTPETAFEDARKLAATRKEVFTNPAFIIANSGVSMDGEPFVEGIIQEFEKSSTHGGRDVTIFGGKAGDDLELKSTFVFTNGKSKDSALVALIIDEDKIDVRGIATSGWKTIGTTKTVTKSDILMNYLGVEIKQEDNKEI